MENGQHLEHGGIENIKNASTEHPTDNQEVCAHTCHTHTHAVFRLIEIPGTVDVEAMKEKEKENTTTFLGTFATLCKHYVCFCYCQLIVAQQSQGVFHNPTTCT